MYRTRFDQHPLCYIEFNEGFMLFLFYSLISQMSGQVFYWSTILVLFALVWTDFNVDKYIIGMRLQCCCIWIDHKLSQCVLQVLTSVFSSNDIVWLRQCLNYLNTKSKYLKILLLFTKCLNSVQSLVKPNRVQKFDIKF